VDLLQMESAGPLNARQKQFVHMIRAGADALEKEIQSYQERLKTAGQNQ
jgi:hypothetical protein